MNWEDEYLSQSVLVVEDDDSIVEALSFLMEKAGFDVRVARTGTQAIEMISQKIPQLMLLDIMMPGCDGFEVTRSVRENQKNSDVKILMLTAKNRPVDEQKAYDLGVDAFMTKPFSTRDVVERAKQLLGLEE